MSREFNLSDQSAMFKQFYAKSSTSAVNGKAPLASILMKDKEAQWVGSQFIQPVRFTVSAGLGYRSRGEVLPEPQSAAVSQVAFSAKRAYVTIELDREAILASRNDKGAFAKATAHEVDAAVEGFMLHNVERALFGDSSGILGECDQAASTTGSGTTGSPWVIPMEATIGDLADSSTTPVFKSKYFVRGGLYDLYTTGGAYQMTVQIQSINSSASPPTISAVLVTAGASSSISGTGAANWLWYWSGNRDKEITGLRNICTTSTSGNLYGIARSEELWRGDVTTVSGSLAEDDLNRAVENVHEKSGEEPNLIVASHKGMAILKNLVEADKRYIMTDVKSSDGSIGFKGMNVQTSGGAIPVVASQMCPNDHIYLLNTKYLKLVMRQDFGWFEEDGSPFLRHPDKDQLSARYGGYFEFYCSKPSAQYRISGFTVP